MNAPIATIPRSLLVSALTREGKARTAKARTMLKGNPAPSVLILVAETLQDAAEVGKLVEKVEASAESLSFEIHPTSF